MPPPPPEDHPAFQLRLLDKSFFVKQVQPHDAIPSDLLARLVGDTNHTKSSFISITRTEEEVSIVEETDDETKGNWRCIQIAGPMDFSVTGVMCNFTTPLKAAGIPVFAISTWNTDYILIPKEKIDLAMEALKADKWSFVN